MPGKTNAIRLVGGTIVAAVMAVAICSVPSAAFATSRLKERVYDDSFGNLIVISPSGYKRIVVGMGHIAAELEAERRASAGFAYGTAKSPRRCHIPAVLWQGRSQMYGLQDGEIPTPPVVCR